MAPGTDPLRAAVEAGTRPSRTGTETQAAAEAIVRAGGPAVLGVIFFGSRKTGAGYDPWSAYDLFVLTVEYASFYRALRRAGRLRRSPGLLSLLNLAMPPNQISFREVVGEGPPLRAKCAVITLESLVRETSAARRDHFCLGRLFQPVELVYACDEGVRGLILDALTSAHRLTYRWVRPWLPKRFEVETYCRTLLRVSMSWEIRPEPGRRADALWHAQRDALTPVYSVLLRELAAGGELEEGPAGAYALARPVGRWERVRLGVFFRWSRARATTRWLKYVIGFDDWLEYLVHKVERHTGETIVLSARERRRPLIHLWPRVIRYLRAKDRQSPGR